MNKLIEKIEAAVANNGGVDREYPEAIRDTLDTATEIIREWSKSGLWLEKCDLDDVVIGEYYVALKAGSSPRFLQYVGSEFRERYQSYSFPYQGYTIYRLPQAKEEK